MGMLFENIAFKNKSAKYIWLGLCLCLFILVFFSKLSFAAEDSGSYVVNNGYACPGMNVLKERYQGDCFPCQIVNVLLASFMRASSKVYDVSKEAGNKLLLLGSALWIAFWALQKVSSLAFEEPSSMTNELIIFCGKVLVAYCFINAGIGTLVSYAINPILGAGAEFGTAMLLETENIDVSSPPEAENQYSGPTDIVSKSVMDKLLKLSESVSNEVAANFVIGNGLTCFSIQNGLHISVPSLIDIYIPDIWLWLCGAAIWCVGFMLVLSVCYYLIDIPFKIGFAIIALPVVIGLWPFKITAGKLKSVVGIALNAAFTFVFLALSSSYAIRLISQAFSSEGNLEINGQTYSGKEALFKAFEVDNEEYVQSLFDFTGPAFLIILFCYIYGFKMISSITNDYPSKFDSGVTNAAGSPLHHMATAATMWTADKVSAPFKTGAAIVANQAGKAATTLAKAGANIGIGAAGTIVGAANKFVGRGISKMSAGWVDKQKNLKAAADSLDTYNDLHQATLGQKLSGKVGKIGASVGLGLAQAVNQLGQDMQRGGDNLMAPGKNTFNRMASAVQTSTSEIKDAGNELKTALKETVAATGIGQTLQRSQRFGKIGDSLVQTQNSVRAQAHQDYQNSVQGFKDARQTLENSVLNTGKTVSGALAKIGSFATQVQSGSLKNRLTAMAQSQIKYVSSGKIIQSIKSPFIQMQAKTQQDILRSKENIQKFGNVGQALKANLGMVQTDLKESVKSLSPKSFKKNISGNWQDLKETTATFNKIAADETGISNKTVNAATNFTGISLGIAMARNLKKNVKSGAEYVAQAHIDGAMSAVGAATLRPAVALGMSIADTASQSLESTYKLAEGALLTGIGVAQTLTSPAQNIIRSAAYGAYAVGDTGLTLVSAAGTLAAATVSRLNVAYQYTKYATRPAAAIIGLPFRGTGKVLGFAAKTVDNSLYAGYKAASSLGKGTMQAGNVLAQGTNVLYHGIKDRTILGQTISKTLKSGSKTLKVAAKTLNLGRNVILAAAGQNFTDKPKENAAERMEKNRLYREQRKQEKQRRAQQRRKEQREKEKEEQRKEEAQYWEEEKRREEEKRLEQDREREKAQTTSSSSQNGDRDSYKKPVSPRPKTADNRKNNNSPTPPQNNKK